MAKTKFDTVLYARMLSIHLPGIIESATEYKKQLAAIETMMDKGDDCTPEETKIYRLLVELVKEYEGRKAFYQPTAATPREILRELMLANGLKQVDLLPVFGHKSTVSEVLSGKRAISKTKALALAGFFHTARDLFL